MDSWSTNILGGLFGGACCSLQIVVNLFNFGCLGIAGFFEPLRFIFLTLSLLIFFRNLMVAITAPRKLHLLLRCLTLLLLSFSPEIFANMNSIKIAATLNQADMMAFNHSDMISEVYFLVNGLACSGCMQAYHNYIEARLNVCAYSENILGIRYLWDMPTQIGELFVIVNSEVTVPHLRSCITSISNAYSIEHSTTVNLQ